MLLQFSTKECDFNKKGSVPAKIVLCSHAGLLMFSFINQEWKGSLATGLEY